jgi:hypothetical protein
MEPPGLAVCAMLEFNGRRRAARLNPANMLLAIAFMASVPRCFIDESIWQILAAA